jgi:hypothetical protein
LIASQLKERLDSGAKRLEAGAKDLRPAMSPQDKVKLRVADQLEKRAKSLKKGGAERVSDGVADWLERHRLMALLATAAVVAVVLSRAPVTEDEE